MKILFVNEKLGWFGGVEQNIADTALGLRDRGVQCFLAWKEKTDRAPEDYAALFAATAPCVEAGADAGETLSRLIKKWSIDRVYFHKIARLPSAAELGTETPSIRMVHDHDLCCPRRHKYFFHNAHICEKPAGWRCYADLAWLEKAPESPLKVKIKGLGSHFTEMNRNHSLNLCLVGSRFMKAELEMNGFAPERVKILPPVIRRAETQPTPAAEENHILFVGQLIRGKGVDLLLRSLRHVKENFTATIVGEGNARPGLEALSAELGLTEKVTFKGWIPNDQLGSIYQSARLLAVPARWPEPFGMIGLEAMSHARPVVAFAVGGIPDWLVDGQTGILAPERDELAFAEAIEKLLRNRDLATKMGTQGHQRLETEYSFDKYLDQLLEALAGAQK